MIRSALSVSITTPTIMMMDVPPKDTSAPNTPLKKIGTNATNASANRTYKDNIIQDLGSDNHWSAYPDEYPE